MPNSILATGNINMNKTQFLLSDLLSSEMLSWTAWICFGFLGQNDQMPAQPTTCRWTEICHDRDMNKVLYAPRSFILPRTLSESFPKEMTFELSFRKWLGVHCAFTGSKENEGIPEIGNSMCRVVEPRMSLAHVGICK